MARGANLFRSDVGSVYRVRRGKTGDKRLMEIVPTHCAICQEEKNRFEKIVVKFETETRVKYIWARCFSCKRLTDDVKTGGSNIRRAFS